MLAIAIGTGAFAVATPRAHAINTWFGWNGQWNLTIMDCTVDVGGACLLNMNGSCRDRWFGCIRDAGGRAMRELGEKLQEGIRKGIEQGKRAFDWTRNIQLFGCRLDGNLGRCIWNQAEKAGKNAFNWLGSLKPFGCNIDKNIVRCVMDAAAREGQKMVNAAKKGWEDLGKWASSAFDNAKRDLNSKVMGLVGGAIKALTTWVDNNVLNPALGMIEGAANGAITWLVDQTVNRLVGSKIMDGLNKLMQQGQSGLNAFLGFLDKLEKGEMVDAAFDVLMEWVRDAGFGVAWAHAGGLVKKALDMLTAGIKTGGQALVAALGSVPGAGGLLAGAATVVLDTVLGFLTETASGEIGKQLKNFFTSTLNGARDTIKKALAAGAKAGRGGVTAVNTLIAKINGVFQKMMQLVKSRVNLGQYRNMAQKLAK